ncbi:hypothetical protein T10_12251 [Trichinella papuae]|uniref:PiggyBac transposable element-derived protein domain-containing protein n=1 Tax=Trichinella papuae TaxID=268474 RepID=A0A0V1N788_9BILA|nr:hypothetical protein T10_12251 [Trichinella papuae]
MTSLALFLCALAVYLQLSAADRTSLRKRKWNWYANYVGSMTSLALFLCALMVYMQLSAADRISVRKPPDVFLVDLRRLAALFGDVSEKAVSCAFVAGMPENVRQLLRVGSRMKDLELSQILARSQAIITDERPVDTTDTCLSARRAGPGPQAVPPELRCYT